MTLCKHVVVKEGKHTGSGEGRIGLYSMYRSVGSGCWKMLRVTCPGFSVCACVLITGQSPSYFEFIYSVTGLSLIVWFLCGLISLGGSLCFAELATSIPMSGGGWAFIMTAFGPIPAFSYAFIKMMRQAMAAAFISLASANYILSPFFTGCTPPVCSLLIVSMAKQHTPSFPVTIVFFSSFWQNVLAHYQIQVSATDSVRDLF